MDEDPTMKGIRLAPGLANTVEEIDRFVEAAMDCRDGQASCPHCGESATSQKVAIRAG